MLVFGEVVFVVFDEVVVEVFYGFDFYDWGFDDIINGDEELLISNFLGDIIDFVNYFDDVFWLIEVDGDGFFIEFFDFILDNNDGVNWYVNIEVFNGIDILVILGVYMFVIELVVFFEVFNVVVNEVDGIVSFNFGIINVNGLFMEVVISVVSVFIVVVGEDFNLNIINVIFFVNSIDF